MGKRWIDVLLGTDGGAGGANDGADGGAGGANDGADGDEIAARIISGAGLIPRKGGEPEN